LKKKDDGKDHRPTTECVIIGYQVSEENLSGLVLATLKDDQLAYAGICRRGWTTDHLQEMAAKFPQLVRETPFIHGLKLEATWLQPVILCEVHSSGWEHDGTMLVGLNFKALLQPRKPK
jgi:ATP-dependent DNA ligase